MYKFLLCWRYLLTRFIALASVVSVMLGVATMIVVNAVMLGFTSEMKDRIQGILADVTIQSRDVNKGFPNYEAHREFIYQTVGDLIEEVTPTVAVPGMLSYQIGGSGEQVSCQVDIVGIDALTQGKVSKIASYLQHPANRKNLNFNLHYDGYDTQASGTNGAHREAMEYAGWRYRIYRAGINKRLQRQTDPPPPTETTGGPKNPFDDLPQPEGLFFDPAKEQNAGIIVGIGISLCGRETTTDPQTGKKIVKDELLLLPGDDVTLTFPTADMKLRFQSDSFTVVDLYESKMAAFDQKLVFVPIDKLQYLRGMIDADSGTFTTTHVHIKVKPGVDLNVVRDRLRKVFPPDRFAINTWQDEQEVLLNAVFMELAMLNVLLFMIFVVTGFGIMSIFYMIVVEKKKDIGILKALGAGSGGVMQIFLYYSLLLGSIGSALGLGMGLLFVKYIKEIATALSYVLKRDIFSPEIYSFYEIPTIVDVWTVIYIIAGAIIIAAAAGVLPAIHAAKVHPVESLRG